MRLIDADELIKVFEKQKRFAIDNIKWCIDRAIANVKDAETVSLKEHDTELILKTLDDLRDMMVQHDDSLVISLEDFEMIDDTNRTYLSNLRSEKRRKL